MATSFTDWKKGVYLAHHGVVGMKWGVRRYQNPDGTLTSAGQKRYSEGAYASPTRLQKAYNKADQVYANAIGERNMKAKKAFKLGKKFTDRGDRIQSKGKDPLKDRKVKRLYAKALKAQNKAHQYNFNAKEAEALQAKILAKSHEMGYSISTVPVKRYANTKGMNLSYAALGFPGYFGYTAKNKKSLKINGNYARVSVNGDRSIKVGEHNNEIPLTKEQWDYAKKQAKRRK